MISTLLRASIATLALAPLVPAQSIVRSFWGTLDDIQAGTSLAEIGDVDGDGYVDMAVGAPNPGGVGRVYWVSGKYLETGATPSLIGTTLAPSSGLLFGSTVAGVGDVTGDGVRDILVGAPGNGTTQDGRVYLVSGASKAVLTYCYRADSKFGASLAACGDVDGDGYLDAVVGCPQAAAGGASYHVITPRGLYLGGLIVLQQFMGASQGFGTAVSSGDVDGDGEREFLIGHPNQATVYVHELSPYGGGPTDWVIGYPGSEFGAALDATTDFDGDGHADIVVGAPGASDAWLVSGALAVAGASSAHLVANVDLARWVGEKANSDFGRAVAVTPDTNTDFVHDILIGAPSWDLGTLIGINRGAVYWISGDTRTVMARALGNDGDHLGSSLSRAWDYDGDLRFDVAAGGPLSDDAAVDGGVMRIYRLFPAAPWTYCTGKVNSQGCTPAIGYSGSASVSSSSPFDVTCTDVINKKNGLLFYGLHPSGAPFQGGHLCVKLPTKRTLPQNSGGSSTGSDCTGSYSYDFNARIQSGIDPNLSVYGQEVFCQYWSRDPASTSTTSLSNALRFVINP